MDQKFLKNLTEQQVSPGNESTAEDSYIIMDLPTHSPFTLEAPFSERTFPLTEEEFLSMFDTDGRLVHERRLRKSVFLGGIQPALRKEVWPFLFGMYSCQSTKREREILQLEYVIKYHEMRAHSLHVLGKLEEAAAARAAATDQELDDKENTTELSQSQNLVNIGKSPSSGDESSWTAVNVDSQNNVHEITAPPSTARNSLSDDIFTSPKHSHISCTVCGQPLDNADQRSLNGTKCASLATEHLCTCFHRLSPEERANTRVAQLPLNDVDTSSKPLQTFMFPPDHPVHRKLCESGEEMKYSLMVNQSSNSSSSLESMRNSSKSVDLDLEDIAAAVAEAEAKKFQTNIFPSDLSDSGLSMDWSSPDVQKQINFIDFQAQIYAKKHKVQPKKFWADMRIVKRDVPRTDRNHELFREDDSKYLGWLHNMLTTYTYFHRDVGYTQGMNDIAASFLSTFQNEPLAYWCFQSYMDTVKEEFKEDGLVRKMDKVQQLLNEVDAEVRCHLTKYNLSMVCCQRWLVVGFKREFDLEDSLKCFEIINSRYLELTAVETELSRRKDCKRDSDDFGGILRMVSSMDKPPYSFDIFMCAALLLELREEIFKWTSLEDIYLGMNSIKIDLNDAIQKGEQLFHYYCKKMVDDCFLEVNPSLASNDLS